MKKVAIVNRTNLKNFGSVLQVYALCASVNKLGYDAEVVWQSGNLSKNYDLRPNKLFNIGVKMLLHPKLAISLIKLVLTKKKAPIDPTKNQLFDEFVANNFKRAFYSHDELVKVASTDFYYKFICGSDQVWVTTTLYPDPMMYLRFAPRKKRVAYAPSLGRDYIPNYNKKVLRHYINDIDFVSVREDNGQFLIKELTGKNVPVVADPTLLINSSEWNHLRASLETPQHYALCYFLDEPCDEVKDAICKYAKNTNKKVVVLGRIENLDMSSDDIIRPAAGPGEFLTLISKADMVITDSYHGMLFAINYHKLFWAVERAYTEYDQSSRQLTILSRLGIENRYQKSNFNFTDLEIDYSTIQSKMDDFVSFSLNYLKTSLEN